MVHTYQSAMSWTGPGWETPVPMGFLAPTRLSAKQIPGLDAGRDSPCQLRWVSAHLRLIDGKFLNFRALFREGCKWWGQRYPWALGGRAADSLRAGGRGLEGVLGSAHRPGIQGGVCVSGHHTISSAAGAGAGSDPLEAHLSDLLQAVAALQTRYPVLGGPRVRGAVAALVSAVQGLAQTQGTGSRNRYSEIFRSLDNLEISLGNAAVEMLVGDSESDYPEPGVETNEIQSWSSPFPGGPAPLTGEELDIRLVRSEGGVEAALDYAKMWSKHIKEILSWTEKRASYELEFSKNIMKLAEAAKVSIQQQHPPGPLRDVYGLFLEQDFTLGELMLQILAQQKRDYCQPLVVQRNEIEKRRKEMKAQWAREQKRMNEAVLALRRARIQYLQRSEDAQTRILGFPEVPSKQQERRRRSREDAQAKVRAWSLILLSVSISPPGSASQCLCFPSLSIPWFLQAQEAEAHYQACIREANLRQRDLEATKQRIVSRVRKMLFQGDVELKKVSLNFFSLRGGLAERGPQGFSALSECCTPFEPGQQYLEFVQTMWPEPPPPAPPDFSFQEFVASAHSSPLDARKKVPSQQSLQSNESLLELNLWEEPGDHGSLGTCLGSDVDSVGGSSESRSLDSPTSSPELGDGPDNETSCPLKKWSLSSAAQTHRFRKLRGPAKCRECEAFMVSGIECEECSLACHKRCLQSLLILCGHRKLPARTQLFGVDFSQLPRDFPEEVPFLVIKCTAEIEHRALGVQGIYRISGSRLRVERLCQAFENGWALVELSGNSPHDVTGVLKHFLKELTDPIIPSQLYCAFISLAKNLQPEVSSDASGNTEPELNLNPSPSAHPEAEAVSALKNLLRQLPGSNYNTLRHLVAHLFRVASRFEENKMSANNLGIVFGPTLLRPPKGQGGVSTSPVACLLDSGYQAQMVEFLIIHYEHVFGMEELPSVPAETSDPGTPGPASQTSACGEGSETAGLQALSDETSLPKGDFIEWVTAEGEEESNQVREETPLGTQSRGHFSRQPVKYPRAGGVRPVIHQLSSLALVASKLCEETPVKDRRGSVRGQGPWASASPEGSPFRRGKLPKHFEITQETARLLSKLQGEGTQDGRQSPCWPEPEPQPPPQPCQSEPSLPLDSQAQFELQPQCDEAEDHL
ncbi:GEM-interacting protein isoform X2 [Monodelphis domestica]|uniref:GEM-interacting protein isoform X2 n=1 Tax=Monodelphis domestica TaxID=13616 RepID=UPI0024E19857|nr:GEM-interacting protein isoform X2 [Monodelphis domestica]